MASFKVPSLPPYLPAELLAEIDASVRRFEEQCGLYLAFIKSSGHIENYRNEVTAMVTKAYEYGMRRQPADHDVIGGS